MRPMRRALAAVLVAVAALAASAAPALAHAALADSSPPAGGRVKVGPRAALLRFTEPVEILNRRDVTVVDSDGVQIDAGTARTTPGDPSRVVVPLRGPLVPDSYTVRVRVVSADSHAAFTAFVFAVGGARLGPPILAGSGGLSDTSLAAVAARAAELAALLLLVGLVVFRVLVWDPALGSAGALPPRERVRAARDARRWFWRALWALAVAAGLAEAAVLAAKSAVVFHTGLLAAALHPADAYRLVAASRFGDLFGWRCGALIALVVAAFAAWNAETADRPSSGRRARVAAIALPGVAALVLLAAQGHASQAPLAPLSVAFDAIHLTAVATWMGGLAGLVALLLTAPRALPEAGRGLAAAALARFSRIALWSVLVIAATGLARAAGELSSPAQLATTGYGLSLMIKSALLAPILVLARRNRAVVARLAGGWTPSAGRLRAVAHAARAELAIAMAVVGVAALLVAQVPGRG